MKSPKYQKENLCLLEYMAAISSRSKSRKALAVIGVPSCYQSVLLVIGRRLSKGHCFGAWKIVEIIAHPCV